MNHLVNFDACVGGIIQDIPPVVPGDTWRFTEVSGKGLVVLHGNGARYKIRGDYLLFHCWLDENEWTFYETDDELLNEIIERYGPDAILEGKDE